MFNIELTKTYFEMGIIVIYMILSHFYNESVGFLIIA